MDKFKPGDKVRFKENQYQCTYSVNGPTKRVIYNKNQNLIVDRVCYEWIYLVGDGFKHHIDLFILVSRKGKNFEFRTNF